MSYDLVLAVGFAGRGKRLRAYLADLMRLQPGQRVLDVGCGTGSLALALGPRVAPGGEIVGIDPSPEMIQRAEEKARTSGLPVSFRSAAAQELPFPDASFDAGVSTLVMHHIPEEDRLTAVHELLRVLRPGARVVLADFRPPTGLLWRGLTRLRFSSAMADSDLGRLVELAGVAGLADVRLDGTPVQWLGAVSGVKP